MNDAKYLLKLKPKAHIKLCKITSGVNDCYYDINGLHSRVLGATLSGVSVELLLTRSDCLAIYGMVTRLIAKSRERSSIDFGLSNLRRDLWPTYNAACKEIRDIT